MSQFSKRRRRRLSAMASLAAVAVILLSPATARAEDKAAALLFAPRLPRAPGPDGIVMLRVENPGAATLVPRLLTFGQSFVQGDLPAGDALIASLAGQILAVQCDAKTAHADGSVAWAVISILVPPLAARSSLDILLSRQGQGGGGVPSGLPLAPPSNYDVSVSVTQHHGDAATTLKTIDVGALARAMGTGDKAASWLRGPLVQETRLTVPLFDALTARFDVRSQGDQIVVTDIALLNDAIFNPLSRAETYDIAIASHGRILVRQLGLHQAPMQEWEQTVWTGADASATMPELRVIYDVAYLERSGAVPGYDVSSGVAAQLIAGEIAAINQSPPRPLGSALVTLYQPSTGARADIGPTTAWSANWLVSQSDAAYRIMLANEAAAAAAPIHARNDDGSLVTTADRPDFWLDNRNQGEKQTVDFATILSLTGWTPDPAHIPDLAYVVALTSGRRAAVDQVQAQATFDLLSIAPAYRARGSALIGAQERGIAWTLRDLVNAAFLTPDDAPIKGYFLRQLHDIIDSQRRYYVHGPAGAGQGALHGYVMGAFDADQVAPWQQGYLALALAQAATDGIDGAAELLRWMNNFLAGLYLNGANGYPPLDGSYYWLTVGDRAEPGGALLSLTSWQALADRNLAGKPLPTVLAGFPDDAIGGFSTIAKAALAASWNVLQSTDDLAAYAFITQHTAPLIQRISGYASSQTWNITPTLPDGHHLRNAEVAWGHGGTTTARSAHSLLAAVSGDNVLRAGKGDSILIGGDGSDHLEGGDGDDFLFAGTGAQTLSGGAGNNFLEGHLNGGVAPDLFILRCDDNAHDIIVNFRADTDKIVLRGARPGMSASDILAHATLSADGGVTLHLTSEHEVTIRGLSVRQLAIGSILVQ